MNTQQMLTADVVADYLQVSVKSVVRFIKRKELRASKIGGAWKFKPEWVEVFVKSRENC